ncbi:hypothetical protein [Jidongwangia harbinensis]|uniref:hypothetical protein n=1 Tax=Jidongwangia harbinensis TaxID=2878561 RepID=UPI001CD9B91D|nr:hypothetical protein [Jidongwangia harbinensis]MCA2215953.1 hypothetical protein [Jidongwangia harbinensis]
MVRIASRGRWARLPLTATAIALAAVAPAGHPAPGPALPTIVDQCESVKAGYADLGAGMRVDCVVVRAAQRAGSPTGFSVVSPSDPLTEPLPVALSPGLLRVPEPAALATGGRAGCVTGPGRPVVATTTPTLSVTFAAVPPALPVDATFQYEPLRGSDGVVVASGVTTTAAALPATLDFEGDPLGPGESYRWRVRGTPAGAIVPGWSPWCEFTVAADVPDLRGLGADADAVRELGLDPARRYTVTLTLRQWRAVRKPFRAAGDQARVLAVHQVVAVGPGGERVPTEPGLDGLDPDQADAIRRTEQIDAAVRKQIRDAAARPGRPVAVTLTGRQWASLATDLATRANEADEVADEATEPDVMPDGSAYWAVLDRVSARLGGPARPGLGHRR